MQNKCSSAKAIPVQVATCVCTFSFLKVADDNSVNIKTALFRECLATEKENDGRIMSILFQTFACFMASSMTKACNASDFAGLHRGHVQALPRFLLRCFDKKSELYLPCNEWMMSNPRYNLQFSSKLGPNKGEFVIKNQVVVNVSVCRINIQCS